MALAAIELRKVAFHSGKEAILKEVSLSLELGQRLVLVGPSGAGKSVLLKLMAGLLEPTEGQILIFGKSLQEASEAERETLSLRMGMLFQRNALFDSLTVAENVAFPLREVKAFNEVEIAQKVEFFLQAVGLESAAHLFPSEISGGMQKRLGIARALALNPEILLYDDPTAGLDPITSRKIVDLICQLQEQNRSSLVAVTNEMARAYQLADQLALVQGGGVLVAGSVEQTRQHSDPRIQQFIKGQLKGPLTPEEES